MFDVSISMVHYIYIVVNSSTQKDISEKKYKSGEIFLDKWRLFGYNSQA